MRKSRFSEAQIIGLIKEMKAVAAKRRRFGYRRIGVMLERA